ncbi:MAG: DUF2240 family protein [Methanomassiliicoccaceae archaeon]|nr:DUF2240 family protein [Methanomassiliicoccaceae archaeon]
MDGLRMTAAAFFRHKGKNVVTETEFIMGVSMDLRWVPPTGADGLLAALIDGGHVKKDGEYLRPAFDVSGTDVPLGFRPSADILKSSIPKRPADDIFGKLVGIAGSSGISKKNFIVSVNSLQKRINTDIEVAALMVLRDAGIDISEHIAAVYELIAKR